jgi:hypothetical protein
VTTLSDSDFSSSADAVVTQAPFPFWLATVTVTAAEMVAPDGTPLSGAFLFTPSTEIYIPGWAVLEGSATLTVTAGTGVPITIPCTDSLSPGQTFTYTIYQRLASGDSPPPITGVVIPASKRPVVDISALL